MKLKLIHEFVNNDTQQVAMQRRAELAANLIQIRELILEARSFVMQNNTNLAKTKMEVIYGKMHALDLAIKVIKGNQ